eukprot:EC096521.1.p3 GENE.EC096521.1~~EC096521.1.p3  ORF type:complete len:101 (-),score=3.54 EC096521.1:358-660(-)
MHQNLNNIYVRQPQIRSAIGNCDCPPKLLPYIQFYSFLVILFPFFTQKSTKISYALFFQYKQFLHKYEISLKELYFFHQLVQTNQRQYCGKINLSVFLYI